MCRPGRSQLRLRKRAFRERAAPACGEGQAFLPCDSARDYLPVTAGTELVTSGAGVTAPGHCDHGATHGATHGFHGAGRSAHCDGEQPAGPVSPAVSTAKAAAFTIPFQGLEVENFTTPLQVGGTAFGTRWPSESSRSVTTVTPPSAHLVSWKQMAYFTARRWPGPLADELPALRPATTSAAAPRCDRWVLRVTECGVVSFPHSVVLPPVDVHQARPFKAGGQNQYFPLFRLFVSRLFIIGFRV